jgi:hypothetical protein
MIKKPLLKYLLVPLSREFIFVLCRYDLNWATAWIVNRRVEEHGRYSRDKESCLLVNSCSADLNQANRRKFCVYFLGNLVQYVEETRLKTFF